MSERVHQPGRSIQRGVLSIQGLCLLLLACVNAPAYGEEPAPFTDEQIEFFEKRIRPVLAESCYKCHAQDTHQRGKLTLDTRGAMLSGGISGPAVVPGNASRSLLIAAVRYGDEDLAMPPKDAGGKLPDKVIADLVRWVEMGAPSPQDDAPAAAHAYDPEKAKSWWAYQPIVPPMVPTVKNTAWPASDIDRFVLAGIEASGLEPVASADKSTLLRRIYIDLIGLPPSPQQQEEFLNNSDPRAFEQVVDQLLSQPQFGERWGRHWMDVARYAETSGKDVNLTMIEAWRYRDYVIGAFNQDKPFDDFIIEQIAGDLLKHKDEKDRVEKQIATGFLAVGPKGLNESDPRQFAVDLADEQIDAVSQAFLGMTVSCARCHDHKFDPISQADYTAVAGIFLSTQTHYGTPGGVRGRNASDLLEAPDNAGLRVLDRRMDPSIYARRKNQIDSLDKDLEVALKSRAPRQGGNAPAQPGGGAEVSGFDIVRIMTQIKQIEVELAAFNPDGSAKARYMAVSDKPTRVSADGRGQSRRNVAGPNARGRTSSGFEIIADSPLFLRGSIENEADKVPRGLPIFLAHGSTMDIPAQSSGRLELAQWIASDRNTLTSRVIVNRVWYWLFGRGLVESVDNFGSSGALPDNQQLLDYLATRFTKEGWSIKTLIREIVLSRVYQMDTRYHEANHAIDPDNHMLWRSNSRRLDAEGLRDSVLFASGRLDLDAVPGSLIARSGDGPVGGDRIQAVREETIAAAKGDFRSVYLPVARGVQPQSLAIFDFVDPSMVLGARNTTIVPPQALYLMNSDFMQEQSQAMAQRVMKEKGFDARLSLACRLTLCREPYPDEVAAVKKMGGDDLAAWTSICRALMSSADFLFVN